MMFSTRTRRRRTAPRLWRTLIALGIALSARLGFAQDANPPTITFSPAGNTHYTSPSLTATMTACDNETSVSSVQLTFNGSTPSSTNVSACRARGKTYTMSLTLQPGSNNLSAQACDTYGNCTSSAVVYYYDPSFRLSVTPDNGSGAAMNTGASATAAFTVSNTGSSALPTVSFTASCTGAANPCSNPNSISNLASGASAQVNVPFTAGSNAGTAAIALTASGSGASDGGSINYPVQAPPPPPPPPTTVSVTPDNGSSWLTKATSGSFTFTVANTTPAGGVTATFSLALTCPTVLSCSPLSPSSVTLAPGASQAVVTSYTGQTPGMGTLALTASGAASDGGSAAITVVDNGTPAMSLDVASANPGAAITRGQCVTIAAGDAAYECGDLRLAHGLPAATTFTKTRAPTLLYNSRAAKGLAFVAANVRVTSAMPSSLNATLTINGATITKSFNAGAACAEQDCRIVIPVDGAARGFATGLYDYSLTVQAVGTTAPNQTAAGSVVLVNLSKSPFGAGWWMAGLERLLPVSGHANQKLWIGGDGDARVYTQVGTSSIWTVTPALDRPDTLEMVTASLWRRRGRNKVWVELDGSGRHVATQNRTGQRTTFAWTDSTLDRISLPVPAGSPARDYVFTYNVDGTGKRTTLQKVTSPSANGFVPTTSFGYTGIWSLASVTDPDQSVVGFGYDASNNLVRRTNRRAYAAWFAYDEGGAVKTDSLDMNAPGTSGAPPIVRHYCSAETASLSSCYSGAQALSSVHTELDGPRTDVADVTKFYVNRFGAPDSIVNALGGKTKLEYATTFPLLVKAIVMPNGFRTEATYTIRGLVDSVKAISPRDDGVNAITTYSWDAVWDMPASVRTPTGQVSNTHCDASGNVDWRQAGGDTTRFTYYADGLPLSVKQSNGAVDTVRYDAVYRNLSAYRATGGSLADSIVTKQDRDSLGRVIRIVSPTTTDSLVETIAYDRSGQDSLHVTSGGGMTLRVLQLFDPEGNGTLVSQYSTPNVADTVKRTFDFDGANRVKNEYLAGSQIVHYQYDAAGNVTAGGRRAPAAAVSYDAINRPIFKQGAYSTDSLTYDANGNVLTANNAYSRITRTYYGGGWLRTETQKIATVNLSPADFTQHVYDLRFTYDIGGRRDTLVLPSQFGGRTTYSYDPRTGQLETVTDRLGNRFRHHYDLMGRLDTLVWLDEQGGKSREIRTYDLRSRIKRRWIIADSAQVGADDSLTYDRRDKVVVAYAGGARDTSAYDAMGHVTYADFITTNTNNQFHVDAMGNPYWSREDAGHLNVTVLDQKYDAGTGRLAWKANALLSAPLNDTTWLTYDGSGNQTYSQRVNFLDDTTTLNWRVSDRYDPSNHLEYHELRYDTTGRMTQNLYTSSESYRYDALGRRVWRWTVRDTSCSLRSGTCYSNCQAYEPATGCISPVTRAVWDGDQILYEMRADGGAHSTSLEADAGTGLYGRVEYVHGLGIDTPLELIKGSTQVIPFTNWRGQIDNGLCPKKSCSDVRWVQRGIYGASGYINQPPTSWYGSLIEGQRDGSGYVYQRNRQLDPTTGRFTQEDPIGLAGGSNLYGFAEGDPINYSDPFGLKVCVSGTEAQIEDLKNGLEDATDSKIKWDDDNCVKNFEPRGSRGFVGIQAKFGALVRSRNGYWVQFGNQMGDSYYYPRVFTAEIDTDNMATFYHARPNGSRVCSTYIRPTLGALIVHELIGHAALQRGFSKSQEYAVAMEHAYEAARGPSQRCE